MRLLPLAATGLLTALLLPASPAPAAEETCQGRPATHVGAPRQDLSGTDGDDVVVTRGATRVTTAGGDDLVCVTGGTLEGASLDAGPGNDVVDASGATGTVRAQLGTGSDHYTGSPFDDSVHAGSADHRGSADTEPDTISTGTGTDRVVSGDPGSRIPNGDVVVLGGGGGHLGGEVMWFGPMAAGARLDGGAAGSTLSTDLATGGSRAVVVDNRSGTLTGDGVVLLTWTRFDRIDLSGPSAPGSLVFSGSDRDERLSLRITDAHTGRQRIDLGGGDDTLWMGDDTIGARSSSYAGGRGDDHAVMWADRRLDLDLASGRMETVRKGRTVRGTVVGFETQLVGARRLTLSGTKQADDLRFWACTATVRGRAGRDHIAQSKGDHDFAVPVCRNPAIRLQGDGGDDRLEGTRGDDVLVGGPGRDTVAGDAGRDRCSGERLRACEVRSRG